MSPLYEVLSYPSTTVLLSLRNFILTSFSLTFLRLCDNVPTETSSIFRLSRVSGKSLWNLELTMYIWAKRHLIRYYVCLSCWFSGGRSIISNYYPNSPKQSKRNRIIFIIMIILISYIYSSSIRVYSLAFKREYLLRFYLLLPSSGYRILLQLFDHWGTSECLSHLPIWMHFSLPYNQALPLSSPFVFQ